MQSGDRDGVCPGLCSTDDRLTDERLGQIRPQPTQQWTDYCRAGGVSAARAGVPAARTHRTAPQLEALGCTDLSAPLPGARARGRGTGRCDARPLHRAPGCGPALSGSSSPSSSSPSSGRRPAPGSSGSRPSSARLTWTPTPMLQCRPTARAAGMVIVLPKVAFKE